MDGDDLQRHAAERAEELPGMTLEYPFGPEWEVFKVRGKVFMLQTVRGGEAMVNLKARPEDGEALRATFAEIAPGYHMNKRHWITLSPGPGLTPELVDELVTESYLLVVQGLPRRTRPVDPETFGRD